MRVVRADDQVKKNKALLSFGDEEEALDKADGPGPASNERRQQVASNELIYLLTDFCFIC